MSETKSYYVDVRMVGVQRFLVRADSPSEARQIVGNGDGYPLEFRPSHRLTDPTGYEIAERQLPPVRLVQRAPDEQ